VRKLPGLILLPALALAFVGWSVAEPDVGQAHAATLGCIDSGTARVVFVSAFTDDDGRVNDPALDPRDNGVDPGLDKRVGVCQARVESSSRVTVQAGNTYPGYSCRFWVKVRNDGTRSQLCQPPVIHAPAGLRVTVIGSSLCPKLCPGKWARYAFRLEVLQEAPQDSLIPFDIELLFRPAP